MNSDHLPIELLVLEWCPLASPSEWHWVTASVNQREHRCPSSYEVNKYPRRTQSTRGRDWPHLVSHSLACAPRTMICSEDAHWSAGSWPVNVPWQHSPAWVSRLEKRWVSKKPQGLERPSQVKPDAWLAKLQICLQVIQNLSWHCTFNYLEAENQVFV